MNATVYLFGTFNSGYCQYPYDYTSDIFEKFYANAKATTQLAIRRYGSLMYYGYIRKLEQDRYIGFCVVVNGLMLKRIDGLFSLFEKTISELLAEGRLIHYNDRGDIVAGVSKLYMNETEIDLLTESLRDGFSRLKDFVVSLPAVSYGTSVDSVKSFAVADDLDEIVKSSYTNGYTFVYKAKGFDTAQMNSYREVLQKLNREKAELVERLEKLQTEHAKVLRQKKQFKFVLILFVVLIGCSVGLVSLNDNLNLTLDALSSANDTISMQMDSLSSKSVQISNLNVENQELEQMRQPEQARRVEAESSLESLENNLESLRKELHERQSMDTNSVSSGSEVQLNPEPETIGEASGGEESGNKKLGFRLVPVDIDSIPVH